MKTTIYNKKIEFFSPEKIMNSGQLFRMYKDDAAGIYRVFSGSRVLFIREVESSVFEFSCTPEEFSEYWEDYLDLGTDYKSLYDNALKDSPYIRACAQDSYGIRVLNQDLFEMMISFIISQQKRIPEIRKCIESLCKRFGQKQIVQADSSFAGSGSCEAPAEDGSKECGNSAYEYYAFPTPEAIASAGPDGVKGLSLGYRERYIYETAVQFAGDDFIKSPEFRSLSFEEAKKYLKGYCGIGEKVANCICLFALGYKDAFPVDVHIKDILHREYGIGDDKYRSLSDAVYGNAADELFAAYSGYKGIIQQWMFAHEIK